VPAPGVPGKFNVNQRVDEMAVSVMGEDKKKALNLAIAQIEKTCGKGSIMKMGSDSRVRVDAIPTGAINLDAAIGVGGIPRGRVTECCRVYRRRACARH